MPVKYVYNVVLSRSFLMCQSTFMACKIGSMIRQSIFFGWWQKRERRANVVWRFTSALMGVTTSRDDISNQRAWRYSYRWEVQNNILYMNVFKNRTKNRYWYIYIHILYVPIRNLYVPITLVLFAKTKKYNTIFCTSSDILAMPCNRAKDHFASTGRVSVYFATNGSC